MPSIAVAIITVSFALLVGAYPHRHHQQHPVPGFSDYYSYYQGKEPPYPGNQTDPILPTTIGLPGPDDVLYQNLLAAEWQIFSFYQQGVEMFNSSSFTAIGLPNTTYDRIKEIRNNEAGHLSLFQSQISSNSIKPGPCKYHFGVKNAQTFVVILTLLEVASMAFLTGLAQQASLPQTKGAIVAIAETETRHNTWAMMGIWNSNPFSGPSDTSFPYANQILYSTNQFIVPGSCPLDNPTYPSPAQHIPQFTYNAHTDSPLTSGTEIEFIFTTEAPAWGNKEYYCVFFHGMSNVTMPFNTKVNRTTIPDFELNKGLVIAVISDTIGAPTKESVVAGPVLLVEQPVGAIKYA